MTYSHVTLAGLSFFASDPFIQKLAEGTCDSVVKLATQWDFAYDGDGVRTATLSTPYDASGLPQNATLTSYYFGGAYEVTGSNIRKYYSFGGQTVMRDTNGLQYFLTDHLGSVVAITDATGTLTSQQRYLPFGAERTNVTTPNASSTDLGYTGQRKLDPGMGGLMDYKARFYSPYLNHFIQPDTIIPDPSNPQAWNRFSYVGNNPIGYSDPTGHKACDLRCPDEGINEIEADKGSGLTGWDWDIEKQEKNTEIVETILYGGTELVASMVFDPVDWALTLYHCANGDCSALALVFMILPGVSGKIGKTLDNAISVMYHSANPDYVSDIIAQGFKTNKPNIYSAWHNNRFGRGVYLADTPVTALAERPGGQLLSVQVDIGKNLDITHLGVVDYDIGQGIARGAREHGFDSITYLSAKLSDGINTVILNPSSIVNISPTSWNNPVWNLFK